MILLQNPQLLSHIHKLPKPKAEIGHTDSFYPAPPSSDVIATATNPRLIGLTESTSAPWVILIINDNISLVGLILLPSMFQTSSTN